MHHIEVHKTLSPLLRTEVNELIHLVWSFEARESRDVEVLVSRGDGVSDPIDEISHHVLARDESGKLVGYGRIAIADSSEMFAASAREIQLPDAKLPIAYISRLVVHPNYRGRGLASLIHRTRIDIAVKLGATGVYGWAVGDKPRSALAHIGFSEIAARDGFSTGWYRTDRTTRLVKYDIESSRRVCSNEMSQASI